LQLPGGYIQAYTQHMPINALSLLQKLQLMASREGQLMTLRDSKKIFQNWTEKKGDHCL